MNPSLRRRYDRVYRSLGRAELQRGAASLDELPHAMLFERETDMWMGFYTLEGMNLAVERYGLDERLREKGFVGIRGQLMSDGDEDLFRIWSTEPELDVPLLEVVGKRGWIDLSEGLREELGREGLYAMSIEWLQLQNPTLEFTPARPRLPGQSHPGLGLAEEVFEMLRNACKRLRLNGMVNTPSYFHNALFYREIGFRYLDPKVDGQIHQLTKSLLGEDSAIATRFAPHQRVAAASWAVNWDMVVAQRRGEPPHPFEWFHAPVIAPVAPWLKTTLGGRWHKREAKEEASQWTYGVDVRDLAARLEAEGILVV